MYCYLNRCAEIPRDLFVYLFGLVVAVIGFVVPLFFNDGVSCELSKKMTDETNPGFDELNIRCEDNSRTNESHDVEMEPIRAEKGNIHSSNDPQSVQSPQNQNVVQSAAFQQLAGGNTTINAPLTGNPNLYTAGHDIKIYHFYPDSLNLDKQNNQNAVGNGQPLIKRRKINEQNQATTSLLVNTAIDTVQISQEQHLGPDLTFCGQLEVDASTLPVVHPMYAKTKFYKGVKPNQSEKFIPSSIKTVGRQRHLGSSRFAPSLDSFLELFEENLNVLFADLIKLADKKKFTALIGPAGCGKTTTSKRLVRATNDLVPFHLRFMDMNYADKLTARQLFMDYLFPYLDADTQENAFAWMKKNPEKCVFIMDGYDQAVWSLENVKPVNVSYDTPLTIQQLVANLCCKKFFSQSMLIFTSRPHAMISIPSELRPDVTIDIRDLPTDSMKKLFYAFAQDRSDELWEMLNTKAPQLFDLCHNPILLQFIIIAALCSSANDFGSITTITGVFEAVLEHLRHSDHARGLDINKLWEPLGRMAYKGMKRKSVVFTIEDLKKEGLIDVDVQDLVIIIARYVAFNQRLFDGDKIIFFIHQMLQEKFAAKYMSSYMSMDEFRQVIDEVVAGGHWAMVRRFLCNLLLCRDVGKEKSSVFLQKMLQNFKKHISKHQSAESIQVQRIVEFEDMMSPVVEIFVDLLEVSDEIFNEFVNVIPVDVEFSHQFAESVIKIHAFCRVLVKLEKPVHAINFEQNLSDEIMKRFLFALGEAKCQIRSLSFMCNERVGQQIESVLPHAEKSDNITLESCGVKDVSLLSARVRARKSKINLGLGGNPIGNEGLRELATCIDKTSELSVRGCQLSDVEPLTKSILEKKCVLTHLGLSNNPIGNTGLQLLAQCVSYIHELELSACGITDLQALTEPMLHEQSKTVKLHLDENEIGNEGINHLSLFVHKLEWLDVKKCGVTDVNQFCEAVRERTTKMKRLDLGGNALGLRGVEALSQCLSKIKLLFVRKNDITREGAQKLKSINKGNPEDERATVYD